MHNPPVHVVATTISGSIHDWRKLDRIIPAFREHGMDDVVLQCADSHGEARMHTSKAIRQGARVIISAGGSGTFNSVLEGCFDSGVPLSEVKLGFLRKGSADLIGKALGMPDQIDHAVQVFVEAIEGDHTTPCDVILARSVGGGDVPRHFVGYGGAEVFGRIPHFTENRFVKYYKGILSQVFGDLGPFTVGMSLAAMEKLVKTLRHPGDCWSIRVDG
jgi:diacylglycerol kinase family enzyme